MRLASRGLRTTLTAAALLVPLTMGLSTTTASAAPQHSMTININGGGPFVCNFNPYSAAKRGGTGYVYEPLMIYNTLNDTLHPWLATQYTWSGGDKILTFTLRAGVHFTNGQALTAADVAFTFNLMHKFPALDLNGVWAGLSAVKATGTSTVVFTFKQVNTTLFAYIAQTPIVFPGQFQSIKNPVNFADPHPIGTGPYTIGLCQSSEYVLKANPRYWQPGAPAATTITVPSLPSGQIADLKLSQGIFDWGGLFSPNIQSNYVSKNPTYFHYWYPEGPAVTLYPNDGVYPLNNVALREAMAMAINKQRVGLIGEYGYETAASQTGLILPSQKSWLAPGLPTMATGVSAARKVLAKAGFKTNSAGQLLAPNGKPVTFTIQVPTGFIDWISDCQLIVQDLKPLGIPVRLTTPAFATFQSNLATGNFTLALWEVGAGPSAWFYYDQTLAGSLSAPEGKSAPANYERWIDPATNRDLAAFAATTNLAQQRAALFGLERIMVTQFPVIPLVYQAWWDQYSTQHFTGWPTAKNPYAVPAPYSYPDNLLVITRIKAR